MIKIVLVILVLASICFSTDINWSDIYDHNTHDELSGVCRGYYNGFLAVGGSWGLSKFDSEQVLLRYDHYGNLLWSDFYRTGAGTYAFEACQIYTDNEYMVVGTSDWAPGYTPDIMLTRYDDNGVRLETQIYEDYGIGTSIGMTSEGDFVIGAVKYGHVLVMMVDGDNLSNVLWTYEPAYSEVADNWMRVYIEVTANDEILFGYSSEAVYDNLYHKWFNSPIAYALNTDGNITYYFNLNAYFPMDAGGILTGIDSSPNRYGSVQAVFSVLEDNEKAVLTTWNITNGEATIDAYAPGISTRAENCFDYYGFTATQGTIFSCDWTSYLSSILFGYSGSYASSDPFFQKFKCPGGDLISEKVHQGNENIIRGPEFHLGDGDPLSNFGYAIAMTIGDSNSSDCYVEFWKISHLISPLSVSRTHNVTVQITNNASSSPIIAFEAARGEYSIDVFDLTGRLVHSINGSASEVEWVNESICSTSQLAMGNYIVRISTGDQIETAKLVIIH